MSKIFISYRRSDTAAIAGRIADRLKFFFGAEAVFIDIDDIPVAVDFRVYLEQTINGCDIVLALIGDRWLELDLEGIPRISDPKDFVRIELETAIERSTPIIPVLVGDSALPSSDQLPPSLESLPYLNAAPLDIGKDFEMHIARLISFIGEIVDFTKTTTAQKVEPNKQPTPLRFHFLMFSPQSFKGWIVRLILAFTLPMSLIGISIVFSNDVTESDIIYCLVLIVVSCTLYYFSRLDGRKWLFGRKGRKE